MTDRAETIAEVCEHLSLDAREKAKSVLAKGYPFKSQPVAKPRHAPTPSTRVFVLDGFVDRYFGDRLVFPGVLRLISIALKDDFPFQSSWKATETHPAYWEVGATIDHLIPVSLGGLDDESNWRTTSMVHNFAKMNFCLKDLGWKERPRGDPNEWDGLLRWFLRYAAEHPEHVAKGSLRQWHLAAQRAVDSGLLAHEGR
jgi:hypothetical protein